MDIWLCIYTNTCFSKMAILLEWLSMKLTGSCQVKKSGLISLFLLPVNISVAADRNGRREHICVPAKLVPNQAFVFLELFFFRAVIQSWSSESVCVTLPKQSVGIQMSCWSSALAAPVAALCGCYRTEYSVFVGMCWTHTFSVCSGTAN